MACVTVPTPSVGLCQFSVGASLPASHPAMAGTSAAAATISRRRGHPLARLLQNTPCSPRLQATGRPGLVGTSTKRSSQARPGARRPGSWVYLGEEVVVGEEVWALSASWLSSASWVVSVKVWPDRATVPTLPPGCTRSAVSPWPA